MLFNTFSFTFIFLPLALLAYFFISKFSLRLSIVFLFFASLSFYSYWDIRYLPLLLISISLNYITGQLLAKTTAQGLKNRSKIILIIGLVINLSLLSYYKYFDFFGRNLAWLLNIPFTPTGITLPIGISFFTFTQIAYLVDCYKGHVREYKVENYGLFVTYFPHLIAGPILHHKEMMPQFDRAESHVFLTGRLGVGLLFFVIGLFKKVILADGVARFVAPVFDISYAQLSITEAWCGALAYTFQLYFDFSAYSDMAYGLSYMFGIILPINFNSPYKACSIIDFWRRWHITLSSFLRDYLYIPLGGNRHGATRRHINLMITMLLGGLWHGANWTFVVWGFLHGFYLIVNHALRHLFHNKNGFFFQSLAWIITFIAVVIAWVFFRANSIDIALHILAAMINGTLEASDGNNILGINRIMALHECYGWLLACASIAFFLPNAYQFLGKGLLETLEGKLRHSIGGMVFGVSLALILLLLIISETRGVSEFLYFNF